MRSTTSYECEVWMDSKKIKVIEVVYWRFFKSLIRVRKTTNTCIVLAKFGKFPFEYFAWGQTLFYYNCVSMVTKNRILGKAWEAQFASLLRERNVGLDPWKNGYSIIKVFCLWFNRCWKRCLNLQQFVHYKLKNMQRPTTCRLRSLQRPVPSKWGLLNRYWERLLGQRTYIQPI